MSVNTCLIYRCLSSASAVIRYSTLSTPEIPPVEFPHTFGFQIVNTPPCLQNSIIVNLPAPAEILKAVRGMVWIFSGIAQLHVNLKDMLKDPRPVIRIK